MSNFLLRMQTFTGLRLDQKLRFTKTMFQELWGHGSEPADNYCYQNYNQLGTANGNCGQFSKYKYGGEMEFKKCSQR